MRKIDAEPLVSVIVPVYNVEKYLDRCMESIVGQTYKNLEIILVDDGSTDNSGKMCDEWGKRDKRVRVVHKENGGVASARNVGLEMARGGYICFVDSDDSCDGAMLQEMVAKTKEGVFDVVMCEYGRVFKGGVSEKKFSSNTSKWLDFVIENRCWQVYAKLFLRSSIRIFFREGVSVGEDLLFMVDNSNYINKYGLVREALCNYFQNDDSVMHNVDAGRRESALSAISEAVESTKGRTRIYLMAYYIDVFFSFGYTKNVDVDNRLREYCAGLMGSKFLTLPRKIKAYMKVKHPWFFRFYKRLVLSSTK